MKNTPSQKNSIDRISSPEQLNERIRVATPGVWLLLTGILMVMVGICVWGIFGRLDTKLHVGAVTEQGQTICYVKEERLDQIAPGMAVTTERTTSYVDEIAQQPIQVDAGFPEYLRYVGDLSEGEWVYAVTLKEPLGEDGSIFSADIVTESVSPIWFVVN